MEAATAFLFEHPDGALLMLGFLRFRADRRLEAAFAFSMMRLAGG